MPCWQANGRRRIRLLEQCPAAFTRGNAYVSDRGIMGLSAALIAELVAGVGPLWHERHRTGLAFRYRERAVVAGAKRCLVFIDQLLATLAMGLIVQFRFLTS